MAPEMFTSQTFDNSKIDCWALGVLMHVLFTGYPPFTGSEFDMKDVKTEFENNYVKNYHKDIVYSILHYQLDALDSKYNNISTEALEIMFGLLNKDPNKRLNIASVLNSYYFKNNDKESNILSYKIQPLVYSLINAKKSKNIIIRAINVFISKTYNNPLHNDIKNAFLLIDQDKNGSITKDEIELLFQKLNINSTKDRVLYFDVFDSDHNDIIEYSEFISVFNYNKQIYDKYLCIVSNLIHSDNHMIPFNNFYNFMSINSFDNIDDCRMIFNQLDKDKDNYIHINDFETYVWNELNYLNIK